MKIIFNLFKTYVVLCSVMISLSKQILHSDIMFSLLSVSSKTFDWFF